MKRPAYKIFNEIFQKKELISIYEKSIRDTKIKGSDGVSDKQFRLNLDNEVDIILRKVEENRYSFTRYRSLLLSKGLGKPPRVICIPTIRDRLTLRALTNLVAEVFADNMLEKPHVHIKQISALVNDHEELNCFVRIDIKDFYPTIKHKYLISMIKKRIRKKQIISLITTAIQNSHLKGKTCVEGIPQGLSISNILSSIYLADVDKDLRSKYHYFRYVDDIMILCKFEESENIFNKAVEMIQNTGVFCHPCGTKSKSDIKTRDDGVEYLGYRIQGQKISVRESSFERIIKALIKIFSQYKHGSIRDERALSWKLNLRVTGCVFNGKRYGWVFFFSQINDLNQLGRLDRIIDQNFKKYDLEHLSHIQSSFIRSYNEIRFNMGKTKYIPKYDNLSTSEMIAEMSMAKGRSESEYREYSAQKILEMFKDLMDYETRTLDLDLMDAIS